RGGDGDDVIGGGLDADEIDGGTGDDCIVGGEGSDTIEGGDGADTIFGGLNPIFPDAFNIRDDGTAGPPDPDPGNGRDLIDGGAGDDLIHGQDDDDTLLGGAGDDTLDGGIDDDVLLGGTGADSLIGGQGDDLLFGGTDTDADRLSGGAGQDTLAALSGDSVQGGERGPVDFDTLFVGGSIPVVSTTAGDPEAGTVSIYDSDLNPVGTVSFEEVERVLALDLNGASPATLSGATGTAGIVDGTDAGDLIDTGYTGDPEGDRVDAGDAEPPLTGDQDVILAGGGDDTVRAGEESDLVFGGAGDDDLAGQAGNDGLSGGLGDDTLSGGAGRDIAVGGAGDDVISGDNSVAGDGGDLLYGNTGSDRFINIGAGETVVGGEDADGSDHDVLDLTGAAEAVNPGGSLVVDEDAPGSESGTVRFLDAGGAETGTMTYSEIEEVIICFTPGTLIATPQGERPVETLQQGDRVITRDNGIQPLAWVGHSPQSAQDLAARPHLRPVRIRAGALGGGLPERDMLVSPNHRLLIANDRTSYYFDEREVLVAAKHLTGLDGVEMAPAAPNTYVHFMFEQHEVVLGDGAWSESFQPGDYSLSGIASEQRDEILELFPELATPEGLNDYEAARRSLKRHEARLLVV
ncbi:MAG TPA: type I secretion protein, partial [Rhodobacteraceae bacterium]|nr:type I secretion protein [Paracoccaceae bacterium]